MCENILEQSFTVILFVWRFEDDSHDRPLGLTSREFEYREIGFESGGGLAILATKEVLVGQEIVEVAKIRKSTSTVCTVLELTGCDLEDETAIDKLHLKKPVFIKMPIEKSDKEVLSMLSIIAKHSPQGVIFGNLQKDRKNPVLVKEEVSKFPKGNFSGKPTYKRSNELIKVTYKKYRKRFVIIGCGGVFCAQDAYEKITLGASLVQIITGMIFEGPQVIAAINMELPELLKKDGFTHIQEAIGSRNSKK
jgi:dihydroorotate dehydrogenase